MITLPNSAEWYNDLGMNNSVAIACKFIKYKITLRNNETPI